MTEHRVGAPRKYDVRAQQNVYLEQDDKDRGLELARSLGYAGLSPLMRDLLLERLDGTGDDDQGRLRRAATGVIQAARMVRDLKTGESEIRLRVLELTHEVLRVLVRLGEDLRRD